MEESNYTKKQIDIAAIAKALSHPARIKILNILSRQDCCYSGDMAELLPIARSTLSQHLKELKKSGLIQGEINPPKIRYCIDYFVWNEAKELLIEFFMIKNV